MTSILSWFEAHDNSYFPRVTKEMLREDIIAFRNGYFNYHTMEFVSSIEGSTTHFFDCDYNDALRTRPTPLWDSLLSTQMTKDVVDFLEINIGRLLFPVGLFDNWQLALFLKGLANTGKSTMINLIISMFPPNSHAVLASNQEATFGLDGPSQKRLFACPDMPSDMAKVLDSALLQSMISGESINVPRKNREAITIKNWRANVIFGSNHLPNYPDNSGSISRRFLIIPYETVVNVRDPLLQKKIEQGEILTVLLRCIFSYRSFLDAHRGDDILTLLPEICKTETSNAQLSLDPLREFIENGTDQYMVRKKVDGEVSWQVFSNKYQSFSNSKFGKSSKKLTDTDKSTLRTMGYNVVEQSICKECNLVCSKTNCGDHYDPNNRRRRIYIKGMEICMKNDANYLVRKNLGPSVPNAFYQHIARKPYKEDVREEDLSIDYSNPYE
jgi:phage/plasmid-associated DNA primase